MRTKTLDDNTQASHPGHVRLSQEKLKRLQPELYSLTKWLGFLASNPSAVFAAINRGFWKTHIEEHLMHGDSRAALVISTTPLLISVYTDELDCIALLRFDNSFVKDYDLKIGSRLITVNTYSDLEEFYEKDLTAGLQAYGQYGNFSPFIAEFLTDDYAVLEKRKMQIEEDEWLKTRILSEEYCLSQMQKRVMDDLYFVLFRQIYQRKANCKIPANKYLDMRTKQRFS